MRFLDINRAEKVLELENSYWDDLRRDNLFPYLEIKGEKFYFSNFLHHLNKEYINLTNAEPDSRNKSDSIPQNFEVYDNIFQKRFYFCSLLHKTFEETPPIIVGGSSLEYYSGVQYPTGDVDLFISEEIFKPVISLFRKNKFYKRGQYYYSHDRKLAVKLHQGEFNGKLELINKMKYADKEVLLIGVEDLIVDRIEIFDKKEYPEELDWAMRIYRSYRNVIDKKYIKKKLTGDGLLPYFEKLKIEN